MTQTSPEKRRIFVDGANMTTQLILQNQFLEGFGMSLARVWNPDALYDDLTMNVEAADIHWVNVALARAQAGDEAVDLVLRSLEERMATQAKYNWPPEDRMTLVVE